MPGGSRPDQAAPVTTGSLPVGSPPATQEQIDNANAMRDAISKAVGTTVDLVYPKTKSVHDGALIEDTSAAPVGFRYDNGQSQYVNVDLTGKVTGVQQRGGGLAAVLPFIEKAVEFVLPATIPFIEGAKVAGEVVEHGRGDKIRIIKFRRRKHHMKQMGHRQNYTQVKITAISK